MDKLTFFKFWCGPTYVDTGVPVDVCMNSFRSLEFGLAELEGAVIL